VNIRVEAWLPLYLFDPAIFDPGIYDTETVSDVYGWVRIPFRGDAGLSLSYGITGNKPNDVVAGTGTLTFTLDGGVGANTGMFAPNHVSRRPGWGFGTPIRLVMDGVVKHVGRVANINPTPNPMGKRTVLVTSYDRMRDVAESRIRTLSIAVSQSASNLVNQILDALPPQSQPVARDVGESVPDETFPYAFDNDVTQPLSLLQQVTMSTYGVCYVRGDGTFVFRSRHDRFITEDVIDFPETSLWGITAATSRDSVYTRVVTKIHPRKVETGTPSTVIYASSGTPIHIPAKSVWESWPEYKHPSEQARVIGALDVVTTLEPGVHFEAREFANGAGTDLTGQLAITVQPFATKAKVTIQNHADVDAYLVDSDGAPFFVLIGNAVTQDADREFEAADEAAIIDRVLNLDLALNDRDSVAASIASWIRAQYSDPSKHVSSIEFDATYSPALANAAVQMEPGRYLRVSETMTGLSNVALVVQGVSYQVNAKGTLMCRVVTAPAAPFQMWRLGVLGATELGETTILGF
jgi:hypothetical protein